MPNEPRPAGPTPARGPVSSTTPVTYSDPTAFRQTGHDALWTAVRALTRRRPFDGGIKEPERGFSVLVVERGEQSPDQIHLMTIGSRVPAQASKRLFRALTRLSAPAAWVNVVRRLARALDPEGERPLVGRNPVSH